MSNWNPLVETFGEWANRQERFNHECKVCGVKFSSIVKSQDNCAACDISKDRYESWSKPTNAKGEE